MLRSSLSELFALPPEAVSFGHVLGMVERYASERADWEFGTDIGLGEVARREALTFGDALRLGAPVRAVTQEGGRVVVTADGLMVDAGAVVVAVPPTSARAIAFEPRLSADQAEALASFTGGSFIKARVGYSAPFWRDEGLSGTVVDGELAGLTAASAGTDGASALAVFIGGPAATELGGLTGEERRARVLDRLAAALGPRAKQGARYGETFWMPSPWTPGGYNAVVAAGGRADAAVVLARPFGGCAFACSELSPMFPGFTEGARYAGALAARSLLAD